MALSVNPLTFVIYVPTAYLTLVSGTLYTMDTDLFRLDLKLFEASLEGITLYKTHNHNTEVTIAGTTFARGIEILAPYSVEFEDWQYTVILEGSNNNIFDVASGILVQNQVQVIPTNSAGLIKSASSTAPTASEVAVAVWNESILDHDNVNTMGYEMILNAYKGEVHLHEGGGSGQSHPYGTEKVPVGNIADAIIIANLYNIKSICIEGNINIVGGDISGFTLIAARSLGNVVTLSNTITNETYFENLTVSGTMNGSVRYTTCVMGAITNFDGGAKNSLLTGTIIITGTGANYFTDCDVYMTSPTLPVEINMGSSTVNLIRCRGGFKITNKTSINTTAIDLVAGIIYVDSTCVSGTIFIGGIAEVIDLSDDDCDVQIKSMSHEAISQNVWDEPLTAAIHNKPTSAGKKLRALTSMIIRNELAQGAGLNGNQIIFDVDASDVDGAYDPAVVTIIEGTGAGQSRLILEYKGSTRTATVDRNWKVNPDATSEYVIISDAGREHVNEGLAVAGGVNTITLNSLASSVDDVYMGQIIFLRSGVGEDQAHRIKTYDGTSKILTICSDWAIQPNTTTGYVILPTGSFTNQDIANSVWDAPTIEHTIDGTTGKSLDNILKEVKITHQLIFAA